MRITTSRITATDTTGTQIRVRSADRVRTYGLDYASNDPHRTAAERFIAEALKWEGATLQRADDDLPDNGRASLVRWTVTGQAAGSYRQREIERIAGNDAYALQIETRGAPQRGHHTRWLNITPAELAQIRALLGSDGE